MILLLDAVFNMNNLEICEIGLLPEASDNCYTMI
jgi:hypothetical protein